MTDLEIVLAVVGGLVTALVVAGMILLTPRGQEPVEGGYAEGSSVNGAAERQDGRPKAPPLRRARSGEGLP
jgi:hypothetical protein